MDIALSLAELNAGLGDYDRALEHLSAADQLTGGALARRFQPQRDTWIERAVESATADAADLSPAPTEAAGRSPL